MYKKISYLFLLVACLPNLICAANKSKPSTFEEHQQKRKDAFNQSKKAIAEMKKLIDNNDKDYKNAIELIGERLNDLYDIIILNTLPSQHESDYLNDTYSKFIEIDPTIAYEITQNRSFSLFKLRKDNGISDNNIIDKANEILLESPLYKEIKSSQTLEKSIINNISNENNIIVLKHYKGLHLVLRVQKKQALLMQDKN